MDKHDPRLILDGVYNLRDAGGHPTRDGHTVRKKTLLRSDSLHRLTPSGQQALIDYGLRTIIDLRMRSESAKARNVFAQSEAVDYLHIPLFDDWDALYSDDTSLGGGASFPGMIRYYQLMVDHCQERIRTIIGAIANPGALPVLLHCAAGKDRTGLIVALLLGLANVPAEIIADDYAQSHGYLTPILDKYRANARRAGYDMEIYEQYLQSSPELMLKTLDYISATYGGVPEYLRVIGLSELQLTALRTHLIEP